MVDTKNALLREKQNRLNALRRVLIDGAKKDLEIDYNRLIKTFCISQNVGFRLFCSYMDELETFGEIEYYEIDSKKMVRYIGDY